MLRARDRLVGWIVTAIAGAASLATEAQASHDSAAASVVREVQTFYASNAICERVGVQVKTPAPGYTDTGASGGPMRTRRASYAIRFRGVPGAGLTPSLSLELGQYQLFARPTEATIAHARNATTYYRQPMEGAITTRALGDVVPPVPLPQLDLAQGPTNIAGEGLCTSFWPYAEGINWTGVEVDPRVPSRRTLRGEFADSGGGTVTLLLSGVRLRMLTIERRSPRVSITLACTPVASCEPEKSVIDVSSRTRVESLLDLKARGGWTHVGEDLPPISISPAGGGDWLLDDLLESPAEAVIVGVPRAEHAVLVFTRVPAPGEVSALARLDFDTLGAHLRSTRASAFNVRSGGGSLVAAEQAELPPRFGYARVLVFSNQPEPAVMLESIKKSGLHWGMRNVLFGASAAESMDLVAPGAEAAVVIIDSKKIVRAVIAVDGTTTTDRLADQIAGALFEVGAPRGMAEFATPKE